MTKSHPLPDHEGREARLRAALEPFDDILGEDDEFPDNTVLQLKWGRTTALLELGDLRRARAALTPEPDPQPEDGFVTGTLLGDLKACATRDSLYAKAAARIEALEADCQTYQRTMDMIATLPTDPQPLGEQRAIPEGMKIWNGGDAAPADWNSEKPILIEGEPDDPDRLRYGDRWDWRSEPDGGKARIIAYTAKTPAPSTPVGQVDERLAIISWLRHQSDLGANRGNEADKGTTKRAAFGGGSLALSRAADAIEAGEHITNDNATAAFAKQSALSASPIPDRDDSAGVDDDAENCNRCGAKNPPWSAPSPLWNAVVRGGSINGDPLFNDMLCATCFTVLAEAADIASNFRLIAVNIHGTLETITPSGRVWDDAEWLWVDATPIHPNAGAEDRAREVLHAHLGDLGLGMYPLSKHRREKIIAAMLAFANVQPNAGVGEREAIERSAESIWQQRWFSAPADTPDAIPVETDEPRRFAEMALAALESKQPPATGSVEVHNG